MSNTIHEEVLVFKVPKKKNRFNKDHDHSKDHDKKIYDYEEENIHGEKLFNSIMANNNSIFLKHDNISAFATSSLEGNVSQTVVCKNDFCCDFKIYVKIDPSTKYRLVTFSGNRPYGTIETTGVRACGIIQCSNDSISSCGSVQESKTVFSNITIAATFHDYQNTLIMPSTLRSDFLPLSKNWTYHEHVHNDHVHVNMVLNGNTNNLVTFGLYSRYFYKSNANRAASDAIYYFIALLVNLYLLRL